MGRTLVTRDPQTAHLSETIMYLRTFWTSVVLVACVAALPSTAQRAGRHQLSGRLVNSLSGDPIPNAIVQIDELRRMTMSAANGTFTFATSLRDVSPLRSRARLLDASHGSVRLDHRVNLGDLLSIRSCTSRN